jgi:WD40 repeat protein
MKVHKVKELEAAPGSPLSRDGKLFVLTDDKSHTLKILDLVTGEFRLSLKLDEPIRVVAFDYEGKSLAVSSCKFVGTKIRTNIWDIGTGKELVRLQVPHQADETSTGTLAFSPDGKTLAAR